MGYKLSLIVFIQIIFISTLQAQEVPFQKSDSSAVLKYKPMQLQRKPARKKMTVTEQIKLDLINIMDSYTSYPNTQETWKMVKSEATDLLMKFYRTGNLMGTKPEQAFYAKIGMETMTTADIENGKMILQVGIATQKPAEFEILAFERMVVGNQVK